MEQLSIQLFHLAQDVENTFNSLLIADNEQQQKEFFAKQIVETLQQRAMPNQLDQIYMSALDPQAIEQHLLQKLLMENPQNI